MECVAINHTCGFLALKSLIVDDLFSLVLYLKRLIKNLPIFQTIGDFCLLFKEISGNEMKHLFNFLIQIDGLCFHRKCSNRSACPEYYKNVLARACGGAAILGVLTLATLLFNRRRRSSRRQTI